ncbi:MAG TPA: lysoplasmalogenase [Tahibacter sp.]|nr:lysoplasmalogenase [Tahibacter sp.]
MDTTTWRKLVPIALCALLAIAGAYGVGAPWLHWVTKPATTLALAWLVAAAAPVEPRYRLAILVGLALSTLGDVFLMLPGDWFVAGLASFLAAHIAYLVALTRRAAFFARRWPFAAYLALGAVVFGVLWPDLPDGLHAPVGVYVVVLAAMAAQAAAVWRARPDAVTASAALGGAFFVASDATLAIDRFTAPFDAARAVVLATYWIAQALIALSVVRAGSLEPSPPNATRLGERVG